MKSLLLIFALAGSNILLAQQKNTDNQTFHLTISVKSNRPLKDSLYVSFWRNPTFSRNIYDGGYFVFPLNSRTPFEMQIDSVHQIGRLTLSSSEINSLLPKNQMVEPGDNIKIEICINTDGTSSIEFNGHGSPKYKIGKMIAPIASQRHDLEMNAAFGQKDVVRVIALYDSLLIEHINLLKTLRGKISPQVFEVLKADALGTTRSQQLRVLSLAYAQSDSVNKRKWKKEVDNLFLKHTTNSLTHHIGLSESFLNWKYEKAKWELVYERNKNYKAWEFTSNNNTFGFIDLYKKLRNDNSGLLRENLLAYSLCNSSDINLFFDGCMPEDLSWCFKDAIKLIRAPALKLFLENRLQKIGQGAKAFNFELASENGSKVKLSDFGGLTVLLEFWSVGCTGCLDFIKEFDRKVYPLIKNCNDVKVVSVSTETDRNKWLRALEKHTRPYFTNCFTEKGLNDPLMKHYEITYVPFVLLIDKEGKIISSTVRNCDKLKELLLVNLAPPSR